jgi:hypothetical protein
LKQKTLFYLPPIEKDVVYTPEPIAKDIIEWVNPAGLCLDPCKGDGAFFNNFPGRRDWCELREGRDFFEYSKKVDFIIGNPPYSIFEEFLRHSFELADDVVYIVPTNKVFQRILIMDMIMTWGGIYAVMMYGSGSNVGFPFGFSVGAFHFRKGYNGNTNIAYYWRWRHNNALAADQNPPRENLVANLQGVGAAAFGC